jgi:hypothetical protein
MEPEGSLPHSQDPATCPYPEPAQSSSCPHPTALRSILILSSHLRLGLPNGRIINIFSNVKSNQRYRKPKLCGV